MNTPDSPISPAPLPRKPISRYNVSATPSRITSQISAAATTRGADPPRYHEPHDAAEVVPLSSEKDSMRAETSVPQLSLASPDKSRHSHPYYYNNNNTNNNNVVEHTTELSQSDIQSSDAADPVQRNDRSQPRFRKLPNIVTKYWVWEAVACIFSLLSLASIVGVLIYEDNKLLDQWAWSVPPTAVVSFLGTLSKASLTLVIAQILSQWKWLHYAKHPKLLRHIQLFDRASRGPLGAVSVIWSSKSLLASLAALLMILTLLVDPFFQLVFSFPSRVDVDDSQIASFQTTNRWEADTTEVMGNYVPATNLWNGIVQGFTSANITPTASCPSGNCVWPSMKTLGVCGSCTDVTANTTVKCSTKKVRMADPDAGTLPAYKHTCNYIFDESDLQGFDTLQAHRWTYVTEPDNEIFDISNTMWNSTWASLGYKSPEEPDKQYWHWNETRVEFNGSNLVPDWEPDRDKSKLYANDTSMWIDGMASRITSFHAVQIPDLSASLNVSAFPKYTGESTFPKGKCWGCDLHWCEKTFTNARVTNGTFSSDSVSAERLRFVEFMASSGVYTAGYGIPAGEFDNLLKGTVWNFPYRVNGTFTDALTHLSDSYAVSNPGRWSQYGPGELDEDQINLLKDPGAYRALLPAEDLNAPVNKLADSLTETFRTGVDGTGIRGDTRVSKSYISVRWRWLALPLALMALTFILLPIVAIRSHMQGVGVWKDDPLALLFHKVDGIDMSGSLGSEKVRQTDLDDLAGVVYVKLDQSTTMRFV